MKILYFLFLTFVLFIFQLPICVPLSSCVHSWKSVSVAVRRAWLDVFISGGCAEAVMLTDSDCEIEHTVSALTQHFLCGKGSLQTELSSPGTAQPQAFYSGWHPLAPLLPPRLFSLHLFLQPRKSESLETCVWTDGPRPNRSPQLYGNQFPAMKMVAFFCRQGPQLSLHLLQTKTCLDTCWEHSKD